MKSVHIYSMIHVRGGTESAGPEIIITPLVILVLGRNIELLGGAHPKKIPKNPIPIYRFWCSDWDFLGFFGFFGIFWDFLGFFWLEISEALKFGKQLFVGNPCIQ